MGTGSRPAEPWQRRCAEPSEIGVYVREGRWGPRRLRVTECDGMITAEGVYDSCVRVGLALRPGFRAAVVMPIVTTTHGKKPTVSTTTWLLSFEMLPNLIWRFGRLFLRCPRCDCRVTRLYVPILGQSPRCRRCWGLAYASQSWSYHRDGYSSQVCYLTTAGKREARRKDSRQRCSERSVLADRR